MIPGAFVRIIKMDIAQATFRSVSHWAVHKITHYGWREGKVQLFNFGCFAFYGVWNLLAHLDRIAQGGDIVIVVFFPLVAYGLAHVFVTVALSIVFIRY